MLQVKSKKASKKALSTMGFGILGAIVIISIVVVIVGYSTGSALADYFAFSKKTTETYKSVPYECWANRNTDAPDADGDGLVDGEVDTPGGKIDCDQYKDAWLGKT